MKKAFQVLLKCFAHFILAELCVVILFIFLNIKSIDNNLVFLAGSATFIAIPMAILLASFLSFFTLNLALSSRLAGYAILFFSSSIIIVSTLFAFKFVNIEVSPELLKKLPELYKPMGQWFLDTAIFSYKDFIPLSLAFSIFLSSFWGSTRLSRSRPLLGAFAAPGFIFAAMNLFSIYNSGPTMAVFSYIGLSLSNAYNTAILLGLSASVLILLDFLLARKPEKRARYA